MKPVHQVIRVDEKRKVDQKLESKLLEGMRSTETELTGADWPSICQEALGRVLSRSNKPR